MLPAVTGIHVRSRSRSRRCGSLLDVVRKGRSVSATGGPGKKLNGTFKTGGRGGGPPQQSRNERYTSRDPLSTEIHHRLSHFAHTPYALDSSRPCDPPLASRNGLHRTSVLPRPSQPPPGCFSDAIERNCGASAPGYHAETPTVEPPD